MKITVCIGTPCHIKGARIIAERLQELIYDYSLEKTIELKGSLCMGNCQAGVCVSIDDEIHSVTPETVEKFFEEEVKRKLHK